MWTEMANAWRRFTKRANTRTWGGRPAELAKGLIAGTSVTLLLISAASGTAHADSCQAASGITEAPGQASPTVDVTSITDAYSGGNAGNIYLSYQTAAPLDPTAGSSDYMVVWNLWPPDTTQPYYGVDYDNLGNGEPPYEAVSGSGGQVFPCQLSADYDSSGFHISFPASCIGWARPLGVTLHLTNYSLNVTDVAPDNGQPCCSLDPPQTCPSTTTTAPPTTTTNVPTAPPTTPARVASPTSTATSASTPPTSTLRTTTTSSSTLPVADHRRTQAEAKLTRGSFPWFALIAAVAGFLAITSAFLLLVLTRTLRRSKPRLD